MALTKLLRQVDEQLHPKSAITVREAIEQWMEVADLEGDHPGAERYEELIRIYIEPRLGHLQAGKPDAELLERFYARLQRCRDLCNGRPSKTHTCRPLSSSTTRKIRYILRGAFERAVRWRYLSVNPAEMVEDPSPMKTKPDPPSAAEAAAIVNDAWRDPACGLLLWLTMITGCRRGELCSLRRRHVDTNRAILWVERSTDRPGPASSRKTPRPRPTADCRSTPNTLELLAEHRTRIAKQCAELGVALDDAAFVFSLGPGHPTALLPRYVTRDGSPTEAAQHPCACPPALLGDRAPGRRGRSSDGGWPARARQRGATTLKTYAAWVEHADRKAAETIATIVPRPQPVPRAPRGPYESIAQAIRDDILRGRLKPGDQLPTIVQRAAEFTVDAGTAHRAMAILQSEGLIAAQRGHRAVVLGDASSAGRDQKPG